MEIVVFRPGTNEFGEGLLWSAAVPFRPVPMGPVDYGHAVFAQGPRPAHRVFGRSHSRMLGEDAPLEPLAPLAPVFEVQYIIVTETSGMCEERSSFRRGASHLEQDFCAPCHLRFFSMCVHP